MNTNEIDMKAKTASSNYGPALIPDQTVAGGPYPVLQVLGRVTADGKLTGYTSGATDGSEQPVALSWDEITETGDVVAVVAKAGIYPRANVTGLDAAAESALETRGIYFV